MKAHHHNHRQSGEEFAAFEGRSARGQFPGGGRRRGRPEQRGAWGHDSGMGRGPRGERPDRPDRPDRPEARGRGFGGDEFGPEAGPREFGGRGRGPEGRGRGHGRGPAHRQRRGPRANRGDVRTAVLLLLADEPMHGYQLMQTIADRTSGRWTPSPGAIYPALNLLEDEGLVQVNAEAGRKLASLTEAGQQFVSENRESWADPFTAGDESADEARADLRTPLMEIREAARQLARTGNAEQVQKAAELLTTTKRELYLLLAGE